MYPSKSILSTALLLFSSFTVSWSASTGGPRQYSPLETGPSSQDESKAQSSSHPSLSSSSIDLGKMDKSVIHSPGSLSPTFVFLEESQRPALASGLRSKRALRIPKKGFNDQPGSNIGFDDDKTGVAEETEDPANDTPHYYENDDQLVFETDRTPEQERLLSFAANQLRKQPLFLLQNQLSHASYGNPNYVYPSRLSLNVRPGIFSAEPTYLRTASKRSPMCLRKCMSQGFLHPAQCHSLC